MNFEELLFGEENAVDWQVPADRISQRGGL